MSFERSAAGALSIARRVIFEPFLKFGDSEISVAALLISVLIIGAGWWLSSLLQRLLRRQLSGKLNLYHGAGYAVLRIGHYMVIAMSVMVALQSLGVRLTSLAVFGGFLGVGLGFGLQNLTANFVSGIILLFEQPIRVGDKVTVAEYIGTVKEIGMRSTVIDTFDNVTLILPNSMFVEKQVTNWSHGDPKIRLHIPFGVAYGSDIAKLKETVGKVVASLPQVLEKPAYELRFTGFGDSSLDFELLAWINDPRQQFRVSSDVYFALEAALRAAEITIPFPQRDLHVKTPVSVNS